MIDKNGYVYIIYYRYNHDYCKNQLAKCKINLTLGGYYWVYPPMMKGYTTLSDFIEGRGRGEKI